MNQAKEDVRHFWDPASCGEELYLAGENREAYQAQTVTRYTVEPNVPEFAGFYCLPALTGALGCSQCVACHSDLADSKSTTR
jgi:hypothetical protein